MKKTIPFIFITAFLINLLYEVSHSLLYNWNQIPLQNTVSFYIPRILYSTLGDAVIITIMFMFLSLIYKSSMWIHNPKEKNYFHLAIIGLIFAVLIELRAAYFNKWSYSAYMPTIFGIGITPLIQLTLTSIIVLYLTKTLNIKNI